MSQSHTPGPWAFSAWMQNAETITQMKGVGLEPTRKLTNEGQAIVTGPDKRVALVDCQTEFKRGKGYQTDCAEREANARLIAAAPDMLAALLNVRALISEAAMTGFNCKDGDWADRLFASQQVTTDAINKTKDEKSRPQPIQRTA